MSGVLPTHGTTLTQSTASFLISQATNRPSGATFLGTRGSSAPPSTGCESLSLDKGGAISYDVLKLILEQQQAAFRAGLEAHNARLNEGSTAENCSKRRTISKSHTVGDKKNAQTKPTGLPSTAQDDPVKNVKCVHSSGAPRGNAETRPSATAHNGFGQSSGRATQNEATSKNSHKNGKSHTQTEATPIPQKVVFNRQDEYVLPFDRDEEADRNATTYGRLTSQVRPRAASVPSRASTHKTAEYINVLRRCDCGKEHRKAECPHLHKLKCSFCLEVHRNILCHNYPTAKERLARIRKLKLCGRCLRPGHGSRKCTLKLRECICHKVHNTAVCEYAVSAAKADLSKVAVIEPKLDMANTSLKPPATTLNPKTSTPADKPKAPCTGPSCQSKEAKAETGSEKDKATTLPQTNAVTQNASQEPREFSVTSNAGSIVLAAVSETSHTKANVSRPSDSSGDKEQQTCPCVYPWSMNYLYEETWLRGPRVGYTKRGPLKCRLCTRDKPCGTCDFTRAPFFSSNDLAGVHGFDRKAKLDDLGDKTTQMQRDPADTYPTKLRLERRVVLPCTRLMVTADLEYDLYEDIEGPTAFPVTLISTGVVHNYVSQALVEKLGLDILRRERVRVPRLGEDADKQTLDVAELYVHGTTADDKLPEWRRIEAYVVDCVLDRPTDVVIPTRRAYQALIRGDSYSASSVRRTPQLLLGIADCEFLGLQAREYTVPAGFTVFDSIAGPIIAGEGWVRLPAKEAETSYGSDASDCGTDSDDTHDYGDDPPSDLEDEEPQSGVGDNSSPQTGEVSQFNYRYAGSSITSPPWLTVNVGNSYVSFDHSMAKPCTVNFDPSGMRFS